MFLFFCISQSQTICLKYTLSVYQKFSFQVNSITISGGRNPGKYVLKNKTKHFIQVLYTQKIGSVAMNDVIP